MLRRPHEGDAITAVPDPVPTALVTKRFRPEIEGVRFVAALLVATYHVWSGRVSGGVDVFFVMSGFLITTTLLGQLSSSGRIQPLAYLSRLALRLLPAAAVVLAAVLVATRVILPTLRWEDVAREVRASALYVENWHLIGNSTDYLARFAEKSPVQHFWALSLQGQFYLLWLVLFLVAAWLIGRRRTDPVRTVGVILGFVFATSLAYSVWFTAENQPVAYFSTPARAWEFALGGLAALALRHAPSERSVLRWVLGWVGLALLLSTGLVLQVSTVFPGYAALLPTSAALMILVSARNGLPLGADRLLGHRAFVWLGGLSYGLYLWHFPLLTFWRSARDTESNGIVSGVAIIVAAVVLAWLTQRLVERPVVAFVERSRAGSHRAPSVGGARRRVGITALVAAPVAIAVVATTAFVGQVDTSRTRGFLELADDLSATAYDLDPCFGAMATLPHPEVSCAAEPALAGPPPELIKATQQLLPCDVVHRTARLEVCTGGSSAAKPRRTVIFVGDSHALTMRVGLELVADYNGWRLLFAAARDCQTATKQKPGLTRKGCEGWIEDLTTFIQGRDDIDVLFTMHSAGRLLQGSPEDDPTDYIAGRIRDQWDRVEASVGRIVVIRDNPRLFSSVLSCLASNGISAARRECSRPRSEAIKPDYAAIAAKGDDDPRTTVADLTHVFCDESSCIPVIGGVIAFVDDAHLHTVFTRTLAPALDAAIRKALDPAGVKALFSSDVR